MDGVEQIELHVDLAEEETLRSSGLLKGEGEKSEIADAIGALLRSWLANVTRDT